jgi:prophage regulatory protein
MRVITLAEVSAKTSRKKTSIYYDMSIGKFPLPIRIGGRVAWVEAEIDAWLAELVAERDRDVALRASKAVAA